MKQTNTNNLRTTPTTKLIDLIKYAEQLGNQEVVNAIAYELAYRVYVPNKEITFESVLFDFGYREIPKIEETHRLTKRL
jgi:hypothetical protein